MPTMATLRRGVPPGAPAGFARARPHMSYTSKPGLAFRAANLDTWRVRPSEAAAVVHKRLPGQRPTFCNRLPGRRGRAHSCWCVHAWVPKVQQLPTPNCIANRFSGASRPPPAHPPLGVYLRCTNLSGSSDASATPTKQPMPMATHSALSYTCTHADRHTCMRATWERGGQHECGVAHARGHALGLVVHLHACAHAHKQLHMHTRTARPALGPNDGKGRGADAP